MRSLTALATGGNLSGMIYGTIVATGITATLSEDSDVSSAEADLIVLGSALVFWIAHVYARVLADAVEVHERATFARVRVVARHEHSILRAAVPFLVVLTLGVLGVISRDTAFTLAVWGGIGILVGWGIVYGRQAGMNFWGLASVTALNLLIALLVVGLKAGLGH